MYVLVEERSTPLCYIAAWLIYFISFDIIEFAISIDQNIMIKIFCVKKFKSSPKKRIHLEQEEFCLYLREGILYKLKQNSFVHVF